jgi:hypothetical protein
MRQINAVRSRAARASILDSCNDGSSGAANTVVAASVLDKDLAATVLGREAVALPAGGEGNDQLVITVLLAAGSKGTHLVVDSSNTKVPKNFDVSNAESFAAEYHGYGYSLSSLGLGSRSNTGGLRESADKAGGSSQENNGGLGEHLEVLVFVLRTDELRSNEAELLRLMMSCDDEELVRIETDRGRDGEGFIYLFPYPIANVFLPASA